MPKHTEHPKLPDGPASRLGGVHNDMTVPSQGGAGPSTYYTTGGRQIDPSSPEGRSMIEADQENERQNIADEEAAQRNIPRRQR
jgi:hypothetical protein